MSAYPAASAARDAFILAHRPARIPHDPWRAHGVALEREPDESLMPVEVATVFLTGRECPWRCAMCDLWKYTIAEDTPRGAIPRQIHEALSHVAAGLPPALKLRRTAVALAEAGQPRDTHVIKLYNAGSFFDSRAVPPEDYGAIAAAVAGFSRVIVESHPALIGPRVDDLLAALGAEDPAHAPRLEVAMGLETAHPRALEQLNKRMTVDQFRHASAQLQRRGVALRVFVLVAPPFVPRAEQPTWLRRSIEVASECGATAISLIPVRHGNGTVEALAGDAFHAPALVDLEEAMDDAVGRVRARVFADLWDVDRLNTCGECFDARKSRLAAMNLSQRPMPRVTCPACARERATV